MKNVKSLLLGTILVSAGVLAMSTQADASEVNTVDVIKAEMHKQQGNKQKLAVYRVQKGDTLSGIAEAAGLTINQILAMNDIPNPNLIHVGQLINLGYSAKANNFVSQTGQSVQRNAKSYTVPTTQKAQAAMNKTKEVSNSKVMTNAQQATTHNVNAGVKTQQVSTSNANQTVASQPTKNQYKPVYNQTKATQKPVVNNGKPANGQWGGSPSSANQSQTPAQHKPVVNNGKPANGQWGGSPSSANQSQTPAQQKPVVNNGKPANGQWGGSPSSSKQQQADKQIQVIQRKNHQQVVINKHHKI